MSSTSDNVADPTPLLWDQEETTVEEGRGSAAGTKVVQNDEGNVQPHVSLFEASEEQQVSQVPSTTKLWRDVKRGLWQFRYPLGVFAANVISFAISQGLRTNSYSHRHYYGHGDAYQNLQFKTTIKICSIISLLTFAWDAYICYQGAQNYHQKWKQQQEHANSGSDTRASSGINTSTTSTVEAVADNDDKDGYNFLKVSQRVDSICGHAGVGKSSTSLVYLLYALWSLAIWQCSQDLTSLLQVQFMASKDVGEKGMCFISNIFDGDYMYFGGDHDEKDIGYLRNEANFTKLPSDVQKWIKEQPLDGNSHHIIINAGGDVGTPAFNQSLSYLQLKNGDLVLTKATGDGHYSSRSYGIKKAGIVVYSSEKKSVQEYSPPEKSPSKRFWYSRDGEVELIGFPSGPPYTAFCGIFRADGSNVLENGAICYNSKNNKVQRYDPVYDLGNEWNGWSSGNTEYFVSGDTLWIATKRHFHRPKQIREVTRLALESYNIDSMKKDVPLSVETTNLDTAYNGKRRVNPSCSGYLWASTAVSILILSTLAAYLYRLDIPSCTVPASSVLALIISLRIHPAAAGFVLLGIASCCLFCLVGVGRSNVLWKYLSTTMLIWALYSLQFAASWVFWLPSFSDYNFFETEIYFTFLPFPLFSFIVAAATNVILNHPFLQMLAVGFGTLSVFSVILTLMGPNFLLIPVGLLVLALGCFRAGFLFQLYRVHIIVHTGRMYAGCLAFGRKAVRRGI